MMGVGQSLSRDLIGKLFLMKRPFKLTWIVTEVCHHRCQLCHLWEDPKGAAPLWQAERFLKKNGYFPWINLSGGELLAHPQIDALLDLVLQYQTRLDWLSFPTAGYLPEKTETLVRRLLGEISRLGRSVSLAITVSIDAPREEHDRLRGRKSSWTRAMETLQRLRKIKDQRLSVTPGLTLSRHNVHQVEATITALEEELPDWDRNQLHLNLAHHSPHYYRNAEEELGSPQEIIKTLKDLEQKSRSRANGKKTQDRAERHFRALAPQYLRSGQCPIRCRAIDTSVFVNPQFEVYPCTTWDRPLGSLIDHDFDLMDLLTQEKVDRAREEIAQKQCPGCWTPCDALPSLLAEYTKAPWKAMTSPRING